MPSMADLDQYSHPDFHDDLNWCTSSSLATHDECLNRYLMNNININNDDTTSSCNEHLIRGGLLLNQKENSRSISTYNSSLELANPNPSDHLNLVMAQQVLFPASIQDYNDHISQEQLILCKKIKEEINYLPRLYGEQYYQIIDEKLLARALQNMISSHNLLLPSTELDFMVMNNASGINCPSGDNINTRSSCDMVLPSVSALYSQPQPVPLPSILDMELHANSDILLATSRLNAMPFVRDDNAAFGPTSTLMQHLLHQGIQVPKVPSLLTGVAAGKRGSINSYSNLENRTSQSDQQDMPIRKSRLEPHSPSSSSFKVRKEKLGDRIAALQQLVAPFGKTDTASVLMEAIGYIKFLQDQVETLSVPYLKLPKSKKPRTAQGDEEAKESSEREKKESEAKKRDLRSRGLCVVPLSCTSYVTNDMMII